MTTIALISCVKSKHHSPCAARDLYTSTLFREMRRYAERHADDWYVLSAEHGLLHHQKVVAPYEKTLNKMRKPERAVWAARVIEQMTAELPAHAAIVMLAGERYREGLMPWLEARGNRIQVPMVGLPMGMQIQWLQQSS